MPLRYLFVSDSTFVDFFLLESNDGTLHYCTHTHLSFHAETPLTIQMPQKFKTTFQIIEKSTILYKNGSYPQQQVQVIDAFVKLRSMWQLVKVRQIYTSIILILDNCSSIVSNYIASLLNFLLQMIHHSSVSLYFICLNEVRRITDWVERLILTTMHGVHSLSFTSKQSFCCYETCLLPWT